MKLCHLLWVEIIYLNKFIWPFFIRFQFFSFYVQPLRVLSTVQWWCHCPSFTSLGDFLVTITKLPALSKCDSSTLHALCNANPYLELHSNAELTRGNAIVLLPHLLLLFTSLHFTSPPPCHSFVIRHWIGAIACHCLHRIMLSNPLSLSIPIVSLCGHQIYPFTGSICILFVHKISHQLTSTR